MTVPTEVSREPLEQNRRGLIARLSPRCGMLDLSRPLVLALVGAVALTLFTYAVMNAWLIFGARSTYHALHLAEIRSCSSNPDVVQACVDAGWADRRIRKWLEDMLPGEFAAKSANDQILDLFGAVVSLVPEVEKKTRAARQQKLLTQCTGNPQLYAFGALGVNVRSVSGACPRQGTPASRT